MRTLQSRTTWSALFLTGFVSFGLGLGACDSGDDSDDGSTSSTKSETQCEKDCDSSNSSSNTDGGTDSGGETETQTGGDSSTPEDTTSAALKDLGEECDANEECKDQKCNKTGLPDGTQVGVCSSCLSDQECMDAGSGVSCGLDLMAGHYVCQTGELGDSCMTDENCKDGTMCAEIAAGQMTCSECKADADCGSDKVCAVTTIDPTNPAGIWRECRDGKSLADGELCDVGESGEKACMNHCAVAMTPVGDVGVCGECRDNADCDAGETCKPPTASLSGLMPSVCEAGGDTGSDTGTGSTSSGPAPARAPRSFFR